MKITVILTSILIIPGLINGQLDSLVKKPNQIQLIKFQKLWDKDFSENWTLKSATFEEVDEFKNGYVLEWEISSGSTKKNRQYSFDLNSKFIYAHEQRFQNDTLISQGPVLFKNRRVDYISLVIPQKKTLTFDRQLSGWNYEVDFYNYEIYRHGIITCIYTARHLNDYSMLFEKKNKEKVKLIYGSDCLKLFHK